MYFCYFIKNIFIYIFKNTYILRIFIFNNNFIKIFSVIFKLKFVLLVLGCHLYFFCQILRRYTVDKTWNFEHFGGFL